MENEILRFSLNTPTIELDRAEMRRSDIIDLLVDHVPDGYEANDAIEIICRATSGRYDGDGWSIWFAVRAPTFH